jgi:hypothetical protein
MLVMAKYRVKPSRTFGPGGVFKAGAIVELDEKDAAPFADKLEPVGKNTPVSKPAPVEKAGGKDASKDPDLQNEMNMQVAPLLSEEGEIDLAAEAKKKPVKKTTGKAKK